MESNTDAMAGKKLRSRKLRPEDVGSLPIEQPVDEMEKVLKHLQEKWIMYVAGIALVAACLVAYALFQAKQSSTEMEANALYAKVMFEEDDEETLRLLKEAIALDTSLKPEMMYVLGEASIRAEEFDQARETMQQLLNEYGDSWYASRAADALAFLKENDGDLEGALQGYQELRQKYPNSLEARLAPSKIAALHEELGNIEEAVAAYREQIEVFPESQIANNAQTELDRIKIRHPEFFPNDDALKELAALEEPIEPPADAVNFEFEEQPAPAPEETSEPEVSEVSEEAEMIEVPVDEPTDAVEDAAEELPAEETAEETAPAEEVSADEAPVAEEAEEGAPAE